MTALPTTASVTLALATADTTHPFHHRHHHPLHYSYLDPPLTVSLNTTTAQYGPRHSDPRQPHAATPTTTNLTTAPRHSSSARTRFPLHNDLVTQSQRRTDLVLQSNSFLQQPSIQQQPLHFNHNSPRSRSPHIAPITSFSTTTPPTSIMPAQ